MTVVVTGASGHLGANVARALVERGEEVRVLVHRSSEAVAGLELELVEGSVTKPESLRQAFEGATRVYHLAGVISLDGDRDGLVEKVNVEGTANVARACRELGVERLVHVSSVQAFDQHPLDEELDETRPQIADREDVTAYNRSKARAERAVREAIEAGLDAVIVNPTGVVGPVDFGPSRTGQVLIDLARGKLPALLEGGFDFVDVRDVAAGVLAAGELDKGRCGENYILGNSWYSLTEVAAIIARAGGSPPPRLVTPVWAARAGVPFAKLAARLTGKEPIFTRESLDVVSANSSISSLKARRELGYRPRPLPETIADTLSWFAEQGRLEGRYAAN